MLGPRVSMHHRPQHGLETGNNERSTHVTIVPLTSALLTALWVGACTLGLTVAVVSERLWEIRRTGNSPGDIDRLARRLDRIFAWVVSAVVTGAVTISVVNLARSMS